MKKLILLLAVSMLIISCRFNFGRRINGNGHTITEQRNVTGVSKIKLTGGFDVILTQGSPSSVRIEADDNLMPYMTTQVDGEYLNIGTRDRVNLSSKNGIKVYITEENFTDISLHGAGDISSTTDITGSDALRLSLSGAGNMHLGVHVPKIVGNISGVGDITLTGETRDQEMQISGAGNYKGADLKSENASIGISGIGDARVFADSKLDIRVSGAGDVYYKGNAAVTQHISGTGDIRKLDK